MNSQKLALNISSYQWKVFIFSFAAAFLMVFLASAKSHASNLVAPQLLKLPPQQLIEPKLEQQVNNFTLSMSSETTTDETIPGSAYGVVDLDNGQVILEKNFSQKLPIASLTKIMTALVAIDLSSGSDLFTVSDAAAKVEPTRMGVIPGQKWSRDELLNALLLTSSNDAAEVLKEGIDQKYQQNGLFVWAMNQKANFLGLKNTSFGNPQGYDEANNFSSVEDLAILSAYAIRNYSTLSEIVAKDYQFYAQDANHKQADLYNWNGLMGVYPGVSGLKIGNTDEAGVTTIVLSQRAGKKVLAVLLGAPGIIQRDLGAAELLDKGFKLAANLEPINITEDQLKEKYANWKYFD